MQMRASFKSSLFMVLIVALLGMGMSSAFVQAEEFDFFSDNPWPLLSLWATNHNSGLSLRWAQMFVASTSGHVWGTSPSACWG